MASWQLSDYAYAALYVGIVVFVGLVIGWFVTSTYPTYLTVSLLNARGLDADEHASTTPVEFDVSIGFLHLHKDFAAAHDGGHVIITYAGTKLAEGPVSKFYVAGGPKRVEATRAVASAGKDDAPLSQMFRNHLWVDQQLHGKAEFDVALSFFDVDITTGKTTRSYHNCKVGLALHGKSRPQKCGKAPYLKIGEP